MSMHSIEPGQRLEMRVSSKSNFVHVVAQAVVPAGYWICRDEASGQQRVVAGTALFPLPVEPAAVSVTPAPLAAATPSSVPDVVTAA